MKGNKIMKLEKPTKRRQYLRLEWEDCGGSTRFFKFPCEYCWNAFVSQFIDYIFENNELQIPEGITEAVPLNELDTNDWIRFKHPNLGKIWGKVSGLTLRKKDNSIAIIDVVISIGRENSFHWKIMNFSDIVKCVRGVK